MILGRDQIIACPICRSLARYTTVMSCNNFGAVFWTDGKESDVWSPFPPQVVKCHNCGNCYWLGQAEALNDPYDDEGQPEDPAWRAAPQVQEPSEEEYYQALAANLATDRKQEKTLRILAWWRSNDAIRDGKPVDVELAASGLGPRQENLEALVELLDATGDDERCDDRDCDDPSCEDESFDEQSFEDDDDDESRGANERIMKAELLRELGNFESAKQILSEVDSEDAAAAVRQLLALCDRQDRQVRPLEFPD
jgi:hypothetical protein